MIKVKNLTLGYEGKEVVKNVTFDVDQGDYICVIGDNGSGKSTLMKALLSLIKPISGNIEFLDVKKNEIGYLPQQTGAREDFPALVKEVVSSGCLNRGKFSFFMNKEKKRIISENMDKLQISALKNESFSELSGGQKQRVLLARALCATQKLLIIDEPVAGLDPKVTDEMYEAVKKLNDEGITIIMVTHDVTRALSFSNKVVHISYEDSACLPTDEYLAEAQQ